MWFDNTGDQDTKRRPNRSVYNIEDIDRIIFFRLEEGCRTSGHKAMLFKEQCRLDMRKRPFSQRTINE